MIQKETTDIPLSVFPIAFHHRTVVTCSSCCFYWTTLSLEGNADGPAHIVNDGDETLLECALDPKILPASLALGGLEGLELGEHGRGAVFAVLQMKTAKGCHLDVEVLLGEALDPDHSGPLLLAAELATDGT